MWPTEYRQASEKFLQTWKAVEKEISIAFSINCSTAENLCKKMDVVSYPTIRLYRQEAGMIRYRGPRKSAEQVDPWNIIPCHWRSS